MKALATVRCYGHQSRSAITEKVFAWRVVRAAFWTKVCPMAPRNHRRISTGWDVVPAVRAVHQFATRAEIRDHLSSYRNGDYYCVRANKASCDTDAPSGSP